MIFCVTRLGIGTKKTLQQLCVIRLSDSGGARTHDPQLRRLLLYPTELRNHPILLLLTILGTRSIEALVSNIVQHNNLAVQNYTKYINLQNFIAL